MADSDAQTIQSAIQILEIGGKLTLFLGGMAVPLIKGGAKGLGKLLQVAGALLSGLFDGKNDLEKLMEEKGNDIAFFEVGTESKKELEKIRKQLDAYGIKYAQLPDLCGGDGKTQFAFSPKDAHRLKMFLRNQAERGKDDPNIPEIKIISAEDYANTGYDENDRPTPELGEILKSAEREVEKERAAKEKEAAKKGKKAESPEISPDPGTKTCGSLDEAMVHFERDAQPGSETIIASKDNPSDFIRCRERRPGVTEYEAYSNGISAYKSKEIDYHVYASNEWRATVEKLKWKSGIYGKCYMFRGEEEYREWAGRKSSATLQESRTENAIMRFENLNSAAYGGISDDSCIIADKDNPENYISCRAWKQEQGYMTEYEAYHNGKMVHREQGRTEDGNARPSADRLKMRDSLIEKSGISGKCHVFKGEAEYRKWRDNPERGRDNGKAGMAAFDEFANTYEAQTSPGFIKKISADNIIEETEGGLLLVDIPELEGKCMCVRKNMIAGRDGESITVNFKDDMRHIIMDKESKNFSYIENEKIRSMWRMGSLQKKARETNNRYENAMKKNPAKTQAEYAKDMGGDMEAVLKTATKKQAGKVKAG